MRPVARITVAVAACDRPAPLARCLEAIASGTTLPAQLVVVDQSADGGVAAEVAALVLPGVAVQYIRQPRLGLSASRNAALAAATILLLNRTSSVGLTGTPFLPGTNMMAVSPAICGKHIGESVTVPFGVQLDSIADGRAVLHRIEKDSGDRTRGDIYDVVNRSPAIGVAGHIAGQEAQPFLFSHRSRRNAGVQAQQICDRAGIPRSTSRTDWCHVLNQREQVSARRGGYRDSNRREDVCQQGIEEVICELTVILRVIHAEPVLGSSADDQLIDE